MEPPLLQAEPEHGILEQILSYFVRNQKAADSLEGVTRWRLLEEQVHRTLQQTEAAINWLVAEGFLQEVQRAGQVRIFRLNPNDTAMQFTFLLEKSNSINAKAH